MKVNKNTTNKKGESSKAGTKHQLPFWVASLGDSPIFNINMYTRWGAGRDEEARAEQKCHKTSHKESCVDTWIYAL